MSYSIRSFFSVLHVLLLFVWALSGYYFPSTIQRHRSGVRLVGHSKSLKYQCECVWLFVSVSALH